TARDLGAALGERFCLLSSAIVDKEVVAGRQEIASHAGAHLAESDESDSHGVASVTGVLTEHIVCLGELKKVWLAMANCGLRAAVRCADSVLSTCLFSVLRRDIRGCYAPGRSLLEAECRFIGRRTVDRRHACEPAVEVVPGSGCSGRRRNRRIDRCRIADNRPAELHRIDKKDRPTDNKCPKECS